MVTAYLNISFSVRILAFFGEEEGGGDVPIKIPFC